MRRFLFGLATLFFLTLACPPRRAQAQFMGYTSPQTISSTPLSAIACTGPTVNGVVPNIGQTSHTVAYLTSGTITGVTVTIAGSNDGTNFFQLSDFATDTSSGVLIASGYFTVVRVSASCTGGGTLTAIYAGTSVTPGQPGGLVDRTYYRKVITNNISAALGVLFTVQPPFGSTGGTLLYQQTSATGGLTLTVLQSDPATSTTANVSTFSIQGVTTQQTFRVPATPTGQVQVSYTPSVGGGTFTLVYIFDKVPVGTTTVQASTHSVVALRTPDVFKPFTVAVCGTETTIWTPASGKKFRVMGYNLSLSASDAAFRDNTGGTIIMRAGNGAGTITPSGMGNGILSAAANNPLTIQSTAAATCIGTVWGVEE